MTRDLDDALALLAAEMAAALAASLPGPPPPPELVAAAAALEPRCETEWRLALALAGAEVADGFDLQEHLRLAAAEASRQKRNGHRA